MFQDNPRTGLLFLAAVAWGSFAAGAPEVFVAAALAVVATLAALWLRVDRPTLNDGLHGYSGVLVGLALATFITPGPLPWAYIVLGVDALYAAALAGRRRYDKRAWQSNARQAFALQRGAAMFHRCSGPRP